MISLHRLRRSWHSQFQVKRWRSTTCPIDYPLHYWSPFAGSITVTTSRDVGHGLDQKRSSTPTLIFASYRSLNATLGGLFNIAANIEAGRISLAQHYKTPLYGYLHVLYLEIRANCTKWQRKPLTHPKLMLRLWGGGGNVIFRNYLLATARGKKLL